MIPAHEARDTRHRVGIYGWSPGSGGVHHHRIAEPLRVAKANGDNASWGQRLDNDILSTVDTVLVHTLHTPRESEAWEDLAQAGTHRLVIDVDDWMWAPDYQPFRNHYRPPVLARLFRNIELAHVVTTPSPLIAEYLARYNDNVHVVHNTVPAYLLDVTMPDRAAPTLGWQCSPSHFADFTPTQMRAIGNFMRARQDWHLHVFGPWQVATLGGRRDRHRVHQTDWKASVREFYETLSMDIGIGPLRRTPFNHAKSALRAVEYAALGIVAVLPDMPLYRGWVDDGVTGRLIPASEHPARTMASILVETSDPDTLAKMSTAARERAQGWTTEANITKWGDAWASQ